MQAVGRIGSYISKSAYTVSGTFHPFGGAVDIIVVEQPDGSYKSSPWYVRFGKFQGVLKSKEKVVGIRVNDEEAGFHMHLDSKGEAFFMQEVDGEEGECEVSPPSSSGEDMEGQLRWPLKSKSCNCDSSLFEPIVSEKKVLAKTNNRQFFGFFGRKPPKDEGVHGKENALGVKREGSLEAAEMAADLLELRWSTNLGSSRRKKDNPKALSAADTSKKEVTSSAEANGVEVKCRASEYIVSPSVESIRETTALSNPEPSNLGSGESDMNVSSVSLVSEVANSDSDTQDAIEKLNGLSDAKDNTRSFCSSEVSGGSPLGLEESSEERKNSFCHEECREVCIHADDHVTIVHEEKISVNGGTSPAASETTVTECYSQLVMDIDGKSESGSLYLSRVAGGGVECSDPKCCSSSSLDQSDINDYTNGVGFDTQRYRSSDVRIEEIDNVLEPIRTRSLPSMVDLCDSLEAMDPNYFSNELPSRIPAGLPAKPGYPPRSMDALGREKNGPFLFKRSTCIKVSDDENVDGVENPDSSSDLEKERDVTKVKANKKKVRTLTPTSKQLESLNLKPGKNTVIFTFSTAMLGNQQVDARVFLWRWDDKIVISDVDGTITRSDLLGQVMPLVGMDWSQTGVAHLFSAIKENGYQLLFLSARSISQSYITRQFLLNIKQDGKALPEGPVVISPDGLFPSLFREVVRRAPHEFKIACLEDIKALFPADRNPFYAGFGNRDTDEVSYLKVGIPLGKIFIINPKGEIAVNRRVDTKSYVSLQALVHGMFPNTFSSEQEDFNSWNFWKLPPPSIDL